MPTLDFVAFARHESEPLRRCLRQPGLLLFAQPSTSQLLEFAWGEGKSFGLVFASSALCLCQERHRSVIAFIGGALKIGDGRTKDCRGLTVLASVELACTLLEKQSDFASPCTLAHRVTLAEACCSRSSLHAQIVRFGTNTALGNEWFWRYCKRK